MNRVHVVVCSIGVSVEKQLLQEEPAAVHGSLKDALKINALIAPPEGKPSASERHRGITASSSAHSLPVPAAEHGTDPGGLGLGLTAAVAVDELHPHLVPQTSLIGKAELGRQRKGF